MDKPNFEVVETDWKLLYRIGGIATVLTLVFYITELVFTMTAENYPETILEWYEAFERSRILGLFYIHALDMVSITCLGLMFIALYFALRRVNPSFMLTAVFFSVTSVPIFVAPRSATFSLLALSDQYAEATTEAQRTLLLTAGEAIGSLGQPTPQTLGFMFLAIATLLTCGVILRSDVFGRGVAYVGIVASVLTIADFVSLIVAPALATPLMITAMLPWVAWWIMISRGLFRLSQ